MTSIAVVAHHERSAARALAEQAAAWCTDHGVVFWMPVGDAEALDLGECASVRPIAEADLVLSLGGDGTMLRSVRMLEGAPVPVLGVNLGSLGYLTQVEPDRLADALDRFVAGSEAGSWTLDRRMMLDVAVNGELIGRALNEAVVEKAESGHTVRLLARIDGEPFTYYAADGLIVATPTGSVVSPRHRAMLLTPVSPHMLFDRTLVLDPTETIEIEVSGHRVAELVLDGRPVAPLDDGDVVRCTPSESTANFVRLGAEYYHQILKAKFGLADR